MKWVRSVPLLGCLSKIEIAKLVPDIVEHEIPSGRFLEEHLVDHLVHFVIEGRVELLGDGTRPLLSWSTGDVIDAGHLPRPDDVNLRAHTLTRVKLVSMPKDRFQTIVDSSAEVARQYRTMTENKLSALLRELNRTQGMLANYAEELWRDMPALVEDNLAVGLVAEPEVTMPEVRAPRQRKPVRWDKLAALAGTLGGLGIGLVGWHGGHPDPANATLGLLVAAAANWFIGLIPDFAVALAISVAAVVFNLAKPATAFSGFISPTWFTLLAVWGIGVAVNKTGLLYRMALSMLRILPPTFVGQSLAMAITGLVTTPFLPSGQSRVVMVAPLVKELAEAMHYRRNSRGMAALGMTSLIGFGLMYFMFLNGSTLPLLAFSLLPPNVNPQITWTFWLWAALPLGLFVFVGSYLGIYKLLPPEKGRRLTREVVGSQIRVLGPMGLSEWITTAVLVITLGAFALSGVSHFEPAWIVMGGMVVLIAAGVLDRESLKRSVDWGFMLFFGSVLSFAGVARANGVDVRISAWIIPLFKLFNHSPWAFVAGVTLITFLVRLVIPAVQSVPLLLIALTPVATAVGIHPFVVSLVVLTMGTNFVIPQQSPFYMALHSGTDEAFTHRQILRVAVLHAVLMAIGLVGSVPYWRWLGLLR